MSDKTDIIGLAAIGVVGYLLIKKVADLGSSALTGVSNTVTSYTEKVTEKITDVKSYIPGTTTDSDKAYQEYKDTVNSVASGVDAVSGRDTSDVNRYLYNAGGGYTDQETGAFIPGAVTNPALDSDTKYTSSSGSSKSSSVTVDNVVQVNPTKQTTETSAFTLEMPDYLAAAGSSKTTRSGSSGSSKTTTVKAGSGGYSVAQDKSTTVNAGKYETIKVK